MGKSIYRWRIHLSLTVILASSSSEPLDKSMKQQKISKPVVPTMGMAAGATCATLHGSEKITNANKEVNRKHSKIEEIQHVLRNSKKCSNALVHMLE